MSKRHSTVVWLHATLTCQCQISNRLVAAPNKIAKIMTKHVSQTLD